MCFIPNYRYHNIVKGDIKDLLQNLNAFCFNCQQVACLYTFSKYRFSSKIVFKSGQLFDILQRAVHFNHQSTRVDRMPSFAEKRLLKKKFKKQLSSSFQKTKSTQNNGSVFTDRIDHVQKTKFELEPIKIVYCFLNGNGINTNISTSFEKMPL